MIDAHQHFWLLSDRAGQWPPPGLAAIHRDFSPPDLQPVLSSSGMTGTVLVQSLPTSADTRYLLDLADRHAFILGVVGWVDLKAAGAAAVVSDLARRPKLKALRPMLQDIADPDWIDDPALDPAIDAMLSNGLCFDALVTQRHLPALRAFAQRHADLPIVIDHAAKPDIARGLFGEWRHDMEALSVLGNVQVKLSGLLTEAGDRADLPALRPYVETLIGLFGFQRLLWGSDWPVLLLAGSYETWLSMCLEFIPESEQEKVFGGNARKFYRLG
ncbi:MAG: amidohydrolase family protein [Janthinobacterium lividum]